MRGSSWSVLPNDPARRVDDHRRLAAKDVSLIERMRSVEGAVCGVTRAEVLAGSRSAEHRTKLLTILDSFRQVATPEGHWDDVGGTLAALRAVGVTVPLADAVLATIAMALAIEVWTRDAHFREIERVLPALALFNETP